MGQMMSLRFPPAHKLVPAAFRSGGTLRTTYTLIRNFLVLYGWWRAIRERRSVDARGNPIPWYSYPAIDFLKPLDFSQASIFEYGAGASTLFWAARAKRVVSVETDRGWYERLLPKLPANCELEWISVKLPEYAESIRAYGLFDVIVIDGPGETRTACTEIAPTQLKPGGMIILDNSDQLPHCTVRLRERDFLQADMTGFAPLSAVAQSTSFFFARDAHFVSHDSVQPHRSVAATDPIWGMGPADKTVE